MIQNNCDIKPVLSINLHDHDRKARCPRGLKPDNSRIHALTTLNLLRHQKLHEKIYGITEFNLEWDATAVRRHPIERKSPLPKEALINKKESHLPKEMEQVPKADSSSFSVLTAHNLKRHQKLYEKIYGVSDDAPDWETQVMFYPIEMSPRISKEIEKNCYREYDFQKELGHIWSLRGSFAFDNSQKDYIGWQFESACQSVIESIELWLTSHPCKYAQKAMVVLKQSLAAYEEKDLQRMTDMLCDPKEQQLIVLPFEFSIPDHENGAHLAILTAIRHQDICWLMMSDLYMEKETYIKEWTYCQDRKGIGIPSTSIYTSDKEGMGRFSVDHIVRRSFNGSVENSPQDWATIPEHFAVRVVSTPADIQQDDPLYHTCTRSTVKEAFLCLLVGALMQDGQELSQASAEARRIFEKWRKADYLMSLQKLIYWPEVKIDKWALEQIVLRAILYGWKQEVLDLKANFGNWKEFVETCDKTKGDLIGAILFEGKEQFETEKKTSSLSQILQEMTSHADMLNEHAFKAYLLSLVD